MEAVRVVAEVSGYRKIKRAFDIAFSGLVLTVGFVPSLLLSALIAAETHASPIYEQTRVGMNGKPFKLYKFRTMVADSDNVEKYLSEEQLDQWNKERKVDNDPRVTRLGKFLRKCSLDEIPNFFNVFLGDMSTIGPRAITYEELEHFGMDADLFLSVPAGITGWWQVNARNDATFESGLRQELELYYATNASLSLDRDIFLKTFGIMLGKNKTGR